MRNGQLGGLIFHGFIVLVLFFWFLYWHSARLETVDPFVVHWFYFFIHSTSSPFDWTGGFCVCSDMQGEAVIQIG